METKINSTQKQYMPSGSGDLTFTGLVFSWFFQQPGEDRIKNWSYNHMLYKTVAKLLYKLRCEDYNTQVNPTNLCHSLDLTSNPTTESPANLQSQSTQLLQMRKPTLKKVQQQHLKVKKLLLIKFHIHLTHILEWWYPMLKAQKWTGL